MNLSGHGSRSRKTTSATSASKEPQMSSRCSRICGKKYFNMRHNPGSSLVTELDAAVMWLPGVKLERSGSPELGNSKRTVGRLVNSLAEQILGGAGGAAKLKGCSRPLENFRAAYSQRVADFLPQCFDFQLVRMNHAQQTQLCESLCPEQLFRSRLHSRHADGGDSAGHRFEQRIIPPHAHQCVDPLEDVRERRDESAKLDFRRYCKVPQHLDLRFAKHRSGHSNTLPGGAGRRLDERSQQLKTVLAATRSP